MGKRSKENNPFLGNKRFQLVREIGEGATAIVYLVEDTTLGVKRAVKVLKSYVSGSREVRARFLAEAKTMAQIEHPGVVRIYDFYEEGDELWIVMEFLEGGSLVDRLGHGPLSSRQAVTVCKEILSALAEAHSHGVIHRDIKPHNILLTGKGRIKVADFGIARLASLDSHTKTGVVMGTYGFMPPEQKVDAKTVDQRADIHAVGALLFACIVTRPIPVIFSEVLEPELFKDIPRSLVEVVRKATHYNKEERYASAEEMIAALGQTLEELPIVENEKPLVLSKVTAPQQLVPIENKLEEVRSFPTAVPLLPEADSRFERSSEKVEVVVFSPEVVSKSERDDSIFDESKSSGTVLSFDRPKLRYRIGFVAAVIGLVVVFSVLIFVGVNRRFDNETEKLNEISVVSLAPKETLLPEPQEQVSEPVTITSLEEPTSVVPIKPEIEMSPPVIHSKKVSPTSLEKRKVVVSDKPVLDHRVPVSWPVGKAFTPEAVVTSDQYRLRVYFRIIGTSAYTTFPMSEQNGVWRVNIPIEKGATGFQYHISAESKEEGLPKLSSGSGFKPHSVRIE